MRQNAILLNSFAVYSNYCSVSVLINISLITTIQTHFLKIASSYKEISILVKILAIQTYRGIAVRNLFIKWETSLISYIPLLKMKRFRFFQYILAVAENSYFVLAYVFLCIPVNNANLKSH